MAAKKNHDPAELVRVRVPDTGHEITTRRSLADALGLSILDKPAADRKGYPLPPKTNPLKSSDDQSEGAADQAAANIPA